MAASSPGDGADDTVPVVSDATVPAGPRARAAPVIRARGYTLGRELARGGMGRVLLGVDLHLGRDVAIKLSTIGGEYDARFRREIELTARLQHPNIIPVYDAGEIDGEAFYAMRPVAGERLDERIARATTRDERFALLPNAIAVVDAIAYAHRHGVIHRDLKPHNVLVGEHGETVVIDWGLGKLIGGEEPAAASGPIADGSATVAGTVFGTPGYMSPEQARGEESDCRSDVYALGCILFQVATGEVPQPGSATDVLAGLVDGKTVDVARAPDLPPELRAIIAKAAAADPGARYADAGELAADLRRYQAGKLVGAHRYRWYQRVGRALRRHRLAVAVAATLVISATTIGAIAIRRVVAERDRANTERAAATELLGFLADDLPAKLRGTGQLEVLDDAGQRLDAYYTRVTPARGQSLDDQVRLAAIRSLRGDIASRVGRADDAAAFADQALALARDAERRGHPRARELLAALMVGRGTALEQGGRNAEAEASLRDGLALLDGLPATPATHGQRARAQMRLAGLALAARRLDEVVTWLDAARASVAAKGAHDLTHEQSLYAIEYLHAQQRLMNTDVAGARVHADLALAAALRTRRLAPWRADTHDNLARADGLIGAIALQEGDLAAADRALTGELEVLRTLAELDPDATDNRLGLASALTRLADLRDQQPGAPGAAALRTEAIALFDALIAQDPSNQSTIQIALMVHRAIGGAALDRAGELAALLEPPLRECMQIEIAIDRASEANQAGDPAAARAHVERADALLAALPAPRPACARFLPFDAVTARVLATPAPRRAAVLDEARAIAAGLRNEGLDPGIEAAVQARLDEVAAARD